MGDFLVIYLKEPNSTAFKPLAQAEVLKEGGVAMDGMAQMGGGTQNWAPIALADGKLLIRDQNRMLCIKVVK
ncbi:hypothetical protein FACS189416_5680 [Bacteroidia bacterium]|nr:hypothetical protein FACS189416_5680 [Bacteroidia bacterium]